MFQENWLIKESKFMQCIVDIVWEYNHSKAAPQKLSFKDINKSTAAQVKSYFEMGLSAGKSSTRI